MPGLGADNAGMFGITKRLAAYRGGRRSSGGGWAGLHEPGLTSVVTVSVSELSQEKLTVQQESRIIEDFLSKPLGVVTFCVPAKDS